MKRVSTIWLVVLIAVTSTGFAATYYVSPGESIQAAIDSASYGDTVQVSAGTYVENITLKNGLTLIGEDSSTTTIDGNEADSVIRSVICDPNTVLENFTITNGSAPDGGGLLNYVSSPTIINCIFFNNNAVDEGGGMYNKGSNPIVMNCKFIGGSANLGGGMTNYQGSNPTIIDCTFYNNTAKHWGGGMYNTLLSNPKIINCKFISNLTDDFGYGGGIYNDIGCNPIITNCTFLSNIADTGGGLYNTNADPSITNCTFFNNGNYEDIYNYYNSGPTITNSICEMIDDDSTGSSLVTYSNVIHGGGGIGTIHADPLFEDIDGPDDIAGTEDDNVRLLPNSPCIDAGNTTAVPPDVLTDLDGHSRFLDDPATDNTGISLVGLTVDMGAYEFDPCPLEGDINCDGKVDLIDFSLLSSNWLAGVE